MIENSTFGNPAQPKNFEISQKICCLHGLMDLGYWIFPLHDMIWVDGKAQCTCWKGENCRSPGKHPSKDWHSPLNPTDPQTRKYVANVVTNWPERGWGLHVGLSGLAVLDLDPRNFDGDKHVELLRELGCDTESCATFTGGGGQHLYFLAPADADTVQGLVGASGKGRRVVGLARGVELFFGQHYVVLPHSPHASGGWYIQGGSGPAQALPTPLARHVLEMEVLPSEKRSISPEKDSHLPGAGSTSRPEDTMAVSVLSRAEAWIRTRAPGIDGKNRRSLTMSTAGHLLLGFGLQPADAWPLLVRWNETCQPPRDLAELRGIFDWIDARPGTRGAKLEQGQSGHWRRESEDLEWLMDCEMDFETPEFTASIDRGGVPRLTGKPRQAALSQAELDSWTPKLAHIVLQAAFAPIYVPPKEMMTIDQMSSDVRGGQVNLSATDKLTCPPPQEESAAAPRPARCKKPVHIRLSKHEEQRIRELWVDCRKWDCPPCRLVRQRHYRETCEHWFREWQKEHGEDHDARLYYAVVQKSEWALIGSQLRIKHASFVRLDHTAIGYIQGQTNVVISTEKVNRGTWTAVTADEAIKIMSDAIEAIPLDLHIRIWWTSTDWPLLPNNDKGPQGWNLEGIPRASQQAQDDILEARGIKKKHIWCHGRFWGAGGYEWIYPPGSWYEISEDLLAGVPFSSADDDTTIVIVDTECSSTHVVNAAWSG